MKKLIVFILLICISLSVCACESKSSDSNSSYNSSYKSATTSEASRSQVESAAKQAVMEKINSDLSSKYSSQYNVSATKYSVGSTNVTDSKHWGESCYSVEFYITLYLYDKYGDLKTTKKINPQAYVDKYGKVIDCYSNLY